ncbi:MAG: hypothetical protein WCK11_05105 [Candidatus Falkowbacteria bacterium]
MKKYLFPLTGTAFFVLFWFLIPQITIAATSTDVTGFNPHYIIDDAEILDYTAMNLDEIQNFLNNKGGFLATYQTNDPNGVPMSAAQIIYDRAVTNKVNPKFLIVLLQKEQSLIEKKSPSQTQLDWAVGYGCFDGSPCNPRWQGFWKQVNSASLQFRDYMDNPQLYNYQPNQTYTVSNTGREPMVVIPQNLATAALYNYTPHVYNGNFNFFTIWQRYFPKNIKYYPNGTLLQVSGDKGVWLIQDGIKRPFASRGALTSRFDPNKIITVPKSELDQYVKGAAIKFPQYALVKAPNGGIYLISGMTKRSIASKAVFRTVGFNPEEVVTASWEDINAYKDGPAITATSSYPTGALLQDKKSGGIYWVMDGKKAPIIDRIFLTTKFKNRKATKVSTKELAGYPTIAPVVFDDGELLKSTIGSTIYVIADGKKCAINSEQIFTRLGYKAENILVVSPKILYNYPEGQPLKLPEPISTSTPDIVPTQANATSSSVIS